MNGLIGMSSNCFETSVIASTARKEVSVARLTEEQITERLIEAARTAHRLPPVKVQGYFNAWPAIKRMPWENLGAEPEPIRIPPSPEAVERMLEVMQWMVCLEEEQRHLLWMRAERYPWRDICARMGCDRTTAWRKWKYLLIFLGEKLES
jgi:hypothetical protein